jgi:hypothetical protein
MSQSRAREVRSDAGQARCPFCGATDVERLSLFGSQLLTAQLYCHACHTPFERLKGDDEDGSVVVGGEPPTAGKRSMSSAC